MCPGVHGPAVGDAVRRLEQHARQTSEVLVLVAMTAADVAVQASCGGNIHELKSRAARHLPVPWEDVVRYQRHLCPDVEVFAQRRSDALDEFRMRLAEVIDFGVGKLLSTCQRDAVLERSWLGTLAGQCDLIDVFLEMPNPLNVAFEQNESDDEVKDVLRICDELFEEVAAVRELATREQEDMEIEICPRQKLEQDEVRQNREIERQQCPQPLPPVEGIAFFDAVAKINHSCASNAEITYFENCATASVVATRDISLGDEVLISYVSSDDSLSARQKLLKQDYGFVCVCVKCRSQSVSALLRSVVSPDKVVLSDLNAARRVVFHRPRRRRKSSVLGSG